MNILYTARTTFDKSKNNWDDYIKWSKLNHLKELVSLDGMLNESIIDPDFNNKEIWEFIIVDNNNVTNFYNSFEYVLKNIENNKIFNLIATIKEPEKEKQGDDILKKEFEFIGYELLDKDYCISALVNCGGFNESFTTIDLNEYGLISKFIKAKEIQKKLIINNPAEHHADCNIFEVWRHKKIGQINRKI